MNTGSIETIILFENLLDKPKFYVDFYSPNQQESNFLKVKKKKNFKKAIKRF